MRKFLLVVLLACSSSARADELQALLVQHRCDIVERLDQIRATKDRRKGKDRYLIVSPLPGSGRYAQCIFFDQDRQMRCEAASGFYITKPGQPRIRLVSPDGVEALGQLGFEKDDSAGNFGLAIATPGIQDHTKIADLMLSALHVAYGIKDRTALSFEAPFARKVDRVAARCRPVG